MNKHSRIIAAILTALFALTSLGAVSVFAEGPGEGGGDQGPQYNEVEQPDNQGGGDQGGGGNDDSNDNDGDSGSGGGRDNAPQYDDSDDDDDDNYSGNYNRYNNDDDDDSYSNNNNSYDSYSNDFYVGGGQTYTEPATVPSTTAAVYDMSKTKFDDSTLTSSDWKDIQSKLTESENAKNKSNNNAAGDFAFIQKNTTTEDNGHWMLVIGFALIILSIIGFISLIVRANKNRKALPVRRTPAEPTEPAAEKKPEKRSKKGTRFRQD